MSKFWTSEQPYLISFCPNSRGVTEWLCWCRPCPSQSTTCEVTWHSLQRFALNQASSIITVKIFSKITEDPTAPGTNNNSGVKFHADCFHSFSLMFHPWFTSSWFSTWRINTVASAPQTSQNLSHVYTGTWCPNRQIHLGNLENETLRFSPKGQGTSLPPPPCATRSCQTCSRAYKGSEVINLHEEPFHMTFSLVYSSIIFFFNFPSAISTITTNFQSVAYTFCAETQSESTRRTLKHTFCIANLSQTTLSVPGVQSISFSCQGKEPNLKSRS